MACVRSRILADLRNLPGAVVCTPSRSGAVDTASSTTTASLSMTGVAMTGGSSVGSMALSSTAETSGAGV